MSESAFESMVEALDLASALADPGEAHGQLCGLACGLGTAAAQAWVADLLSADAADGSVPDAARQQLARLARQTCSELEEGDMSLQLVLPPDNASLEMRAECLAQWCQGFLHGLAMAVADRERLEAGVVDEILRDFSEISKAAFAEEETTAEAEAAYAELVEFVRLSAQLVFEELHPSRPDASGRKH